MRRDGYDVVVIGAGLVGGAIAYGLARAGPRVAVLDEEDATYRASRGNFGLVWVQGKGAGRPEYALWSRASSERWFALSDALVEDCGLPPHYGRPGGVIPALSDDELSGLDSMLAGLRQAAGNAGYDYEMLDATRVRELLPACGPEVAGGAYSPYDGHANPLQLMRGLHASLAVHGADYLTGARADDIRALAGGGFDIRTERGTVTGNKVVIAAGHGSKALGAMVGLDVPVYPRARADPGHGAHRAVARPPDPGCAPDRRGLAAARRIAGRARLRYLGAHPHESRHRAPCGARLSVHLSAPRGAHLGSAAGNDPGWISRLRPVENTPRRLRLHLPQRGHPCGEPRVRSEPLGDEGRGSQGDVLLRNGTLRCFAGCLTPPAP